MSKETEYLESVFTNDKPLWFKIRELEGNSTFGGYMDLMMLGNVNHMLKGTLYSTAKNGYKSKTKLDTDQTRMLNDRLNRLRQRGVPSVYENPDLGEPMVDLFEATVRRRLDETGGYLGNVLNDVQKKMFGQFKVINQGSPVSVLFALKPLKEMGLDDDDIASGIFKAYTLPDRLGKKVQIGWYSTNTIEEENFNRIYKHHNGDLMKTARDLETGNLAIVPLQSPGYGEYVKDGWIFGIRAGDPDRPASWHIVGEVKLDGKPLQYNNEELLEYFASGSMVNFLQEYDDGMFGWNYSKEQIFEMADKDSITEGFLLKDQIPRTLLGWSTFTDPRDLEHRFVIKPLAKMLRKNPKMSVGDAVKKMLDTWMPPPKRNYDMYRSRHIDPSKLILEQ